MAKTRKNQKGNADSGDLTSTSVDGGINQITKTPDMTHHLQVKRPPMTKRYTKTNRECSHKKVVVIGLAASSSVNISGRSWTAMRGVECPKISEIAAEEEEDNNNTYSTSEIPISHIPDDEVQDITPLFVSEAAVNNHLPMENAHEDSNDIGTKGDHCGGSNNIGTKGDNCGGSPTRSVNFTEIAGMLDGVTSDPDDFVSFANPSVVTVHGYRVKEEMAPLLRDIIAKYGDIAEKCTLQGKTSVSTVLEMLCGIVQRLKMLLFKEITEMELKSMTIEISDLVFLGLDVGWLQQRVELISKALSLLKGAGNLKDERMKNRVAVEQSRKEIETLEQKLVLEKGKIAALEAEGDKINKMVEDTKSTLKCLLGWKSLVEGML